MAFDHDSDNFADACGVSKYRIESTMDKLAKITNSLKRDEVFRSHCVEKIESVMREVGQRVSAVAMFLIVEKAMSDFVTKAIAQLDKMSDLLEKSDMEEEDDDGPTVH